MTASTIPAVAFTTSELPFIIEALRKLALQRDTLTKYAEDEEQVETLQEDIAFIRATLVKYGDTRPLVLKSERKAKAKKIAKAVKVTVSRAKKPATKPAK